MNGRRSVWSDEKVIESIQRFVPATDEVWRLQSDNDPECLFFQRMAEQGHFGGNVGQTRQGIYACSPSGELLASTNSLRANSVIRMMDRAWEKWEKLSPDERRLAAVSEFVPKHRWEDSFPEDGLVLDMFARDLPLQCDASEDRRVKWNRDFVWFSAAEARQWLPEKVELNAVHELPASLVQRLAMFHIVDVVRGQTSPMSAEQVVDSTITTQIVDLEDGRAMIVIRGNTSSQADGRGPGRVAHWKGKWRLFGQDTDHGVRSRILGTATFDLESRRFEAFEFVALGVRWGRTRFNGREWDAENASPIGFVFQLAAKDSPRVAPGFIPYYQADWLKRPQQPEMREFKSTSAR